MNDKNKKISPQAILSLKEALAVIFWRKEDLQDFIKLSISNTSIIGTINWNGTKRESVKELIERMTNRWLFRSMGASHFGVWVPL